MIMTVLSTLKYALLLNNREESIIEIDKVYCNNKVTTEENNYLVISVYDY